MSKKLTINIDLDVYGDDQFIDLLGALVGQKKSLVPVNDISVWEYDPDTTVKSVVVAESDQK